MHELKSLNTKYVRSATARNETNFLRRLAEAYEAGQTELKAKAVDQGAAA